MKKLLLMCALIMIGIGYGSTRYLRPQPQTIDTYIDGTWNQGEYRGCILIPPDRKQLYCGVHVKGSWPEVLGDKEHIRMTEVSFTGKSDAFFGAAKTLPKTFNAKMLVSEQKCAELICSSLMCRYRR